jgi:hypothetical protein
VRNEDKKDEKVYDKDETHSNFIVACKKNIQKKTKTLT